MVGKLNMIKYQVYLNADSDNLLIFAASNF